MSLIQVARYSDVKYDFKDASPVYPCWRTPLIRPASPIAPAARPLHHPRRLLRHRTQPAVLLHQGQGYITTPRQAWNINEPGVFVPEFDTERFTITCSADSKEPLEFLHIVTELNDYDKTCLVESRMVLPRFRTISQGWTYDEDFKDNSVTTSMMLLEHRNLGRLSMGANFGTGPNYIGQHIHNELEQWYIMLPGASFTYTAENEKIHVQGGDITYTPHGSHHGSECADGEKFAYVWFELCENGYPGEIK